MASVPVRSSLTQRTASSIKCSSSADGSGNTQGIAALVEGMPLDEVVKRLEGIKCGSRPTSCPDQLAKALKKVAEEQ